MDSRKIGSLAVSVVGLGCNNFGRRMDAAQTAAVVHSALDAGITLFDTADVYGDGQSEEFLGRALGSRRHEAVIATKFGYAEPLRGGSAATVRQAVEASLRRLGTDRIDLYQLHAPDPSVPIAETLGALDELVQAGKVREIGCSNFGVEQLQQAAAAAGAGAARFGSVQNEYSLLNREAERDVLPYCEQHGLAFLPYFPLASGLLTGKVRQGAPVPEGTRLATHPSADRWLNERNVAQVEALLGWAEGRGHTLLDLAFAWLLRWPAVASVIAGATRLAQVQANVAAAGWTLSDEEVAQVAALVEAG